MFRRIIKQTTVTDLFHIMLNIPFKIFAREPVVDTSMGLTQHLIFAPLIERVVEYLIIILNYLYIL